MKLRSEEDALGRAIYAQYTRGTGHELMERDDGHLSPSGGEATYLAPFRDWAVCERRAIRHARGRVLDIGCGAGRHALYLQERGHDVLGIDVSPLCLKVAKMRGLRKTRLLSITAVSPRLGIFDTILLLGNNFGLLANHTRARWLLRRFKGLAAPDGRIIAGSNDVYQTDDKRNLSYQRNNRKRGRMGGQIRLRVRYRHYATPYADYLMVSREEMEQIVSGTGWTVARTYEGPHALYAAVLERDGT